MLPVRRNLASRATLAVFSAVAVLGLASVPALGKGPILEASFDAPISLASPPGAELLVAVTVTVDEAFEGHSAAGAPVWLRLIGPTGATTEAAGTTGKGAGRYEFRIQVPAGGPRRLEVVMPGGPGETDIPLWLVNDPFTFRPMGEGTAQVAPPLAPMGPRAPIAAPAAPAAQPQPAPADPAQLVAPAPAPAPDLALGLLAIASLALVAGTLVATRRRSARRQAGRVVLPAADVPTRAPGA